MKKIRIISIILTFVLLCLTLSSCKPPERIVYPEILDYETWSEEDVVAAGYTEFHNLKEQECTYYQLSSLITSDALNKSCTLSIFRSSQADKDKYPYENLRIANYYTSPEDEDKPTKFGGYSMRFKLMNDSSWLFYTAGFVNEEEEFNYIKSVLDTLTPYNGEEPIDDPYGKFYVQLIKGNKTYEYQFNITGEVKKGNKFYKLENIADFYAIAVIAEKYKNNLNRFSFNMTFPSGYELCVLAPNAHKHYDNTQAAELLSNLPLKEEMEDTDNINQDGVLLTRYLNNTQFFTDDAIIITQTYENFRSYYYVTKEGRLLMISLFRPYLKSIGYAKVFGMTLVLSVNVSQPIFDYDALLALITD